MENKKEALSAAGNCFGLKILSLLLICFFCLSKGFAQDTERIKVKVGGKIGSHDFKDVAYRFPAFQEAVIQYNSGSPAKGNLNYNQLLGEMHFIGPKGDTLALDNLYLVKLVAIGDSKFYYDPENKSFGELIADYNTVKLLITQKFKTSDKASGVAYDQYSNASATTNYGSYAVNGQIKHLNINEYLVLAKRASYYVADQNNQFFLATKANILKIFSKHKPAVERFMKDNRVDLQKEEDLKKLLAFCTQLP
ncbi:MAG: hypothetical protein JWQ14_1116 [Adhaeribacter sp.]|nr:hypothetical protein [Adhaeribacter sp.]